MIVPAKGSYAQNLWDRLDIVLRQSTDRRKQLEQFIFAVEKRIDTEQMYSRNIDATGKLLERFIQQKSCISLTYSAFKLNHSHRAEQAKVFAQSMRDEVLNMLREALSAQNNECKKMEKDARKLEKDMQMYNDTLAKAKDKYLNSERKKQEQQILNEIGKISSQSTTDKKQKQNSYTKELEKQTKEYEQVYKLALKEYNDFVDIYNNQMAKILSRYEEHEQNRVQKQVDTIMKMLVFETSMMRNFDYDITNISRQMEGVKSEQDILSFIESNKTQNPKLSVQTAYATNNFLNTTINKVNSKIFDSKIELEYNKSIRTFIDQTIKGDESTKQVVLTPSQLEDSHKMHQSVSACWKVRQITKQQLASLSEILNSERYRQIFTIIFKEYGVILGPELSPPGFANAATLFELVLDKCTQQEKDVFIVRKLLTMMFSFWTVDNKAQNGVSPTLGGDKIRQRFLHAKLNDLILWRLTDFWEAAIFESIQEELKVSVGHKGQTLQDAITRQKNVVFGQLASYCHSMIMLGNSPKVVRQVVGKFCRLCDMSEQQSKDLSKAISNTNKQYREAFGLSKTSETSSNIEDSKLG